MHFADSEYHKRVKMKDIEKPIFQPFSFVKTGTFSFNFHESLTKTFRKRTTRKKSLEIFI